MRGIYPIIDADFVEANRLSLVGFAKSVLEAGPPIVQLRAKRATARRIVTWLRELVPLCHDRGVLLFANDRPDLARLTGCDGVHVGQDDLPVADVRRFDPELRVGLSTHDLDQLRRGLAAQPDYIAFGPVFPTSSKERPDPVVGIEGLARAHALASDAGVPLVAIGGIGRAHIVDVAPHAELAAVITALLPPEGESAVRAQVAGLQSVMATRERS